MLILRYIMICSGNCMHLCYFLQISCLGDAEGNARGNFLLLDQDLKAKGLWGKQDAPWGYDFW